MTFEDFLDMMSVFSRNAPKSVKVSYAFKIYRKRSISYDTRYLSLVFQEESIGDHGQVR